ncbi:Cyclic pyranopterin monophosphate synthase [Thalassoglobus neptunius]|uniref:Cyclic pyranopterin monophosphate synthase n=1 Tax=Thalassoglobus neptunius TaxID=1938619 RepID=A0A5C5WYD9_9PLAN|nr:adenosyl-hopene transferase HpnH [Thalassoglobus neptunius]TWT55289.1 Cyclic pyranopterin monophosphate synthase [Thalassoglobus neptunius]
MAVPVSQMWTVASYVLKQKLRRRKQYPLVLMLEPLFRCNLACAGCGKIQYPAETLKRHLSVEDCIRAVEECGAPIVSIPGGEPLLHPDIDKIVDELVARGKYIYLCTNAILLEKHLHRFKPSKHLSFSVHLDGTREDHDHAVCRDGVYDVAIAAIETAVKKGFRVTTNTTVFSNADPERLQEMFDTLMDLGVEGMMLSPGYQYEKAPDQEHFLSRTGTINLFRKILGNAKRRWVFNQSPLFIEFLKGKWDLECTPWGNPTYNLFGWQKPCYLLQDGYAETFEELMNTVEWDQYGRASGNERCQDCMVHCGYEPSAVDATFGTLSGFAASAWTTIFGPPQLTPEEMAEELPAPTTSPQLVELET